MGENIRTTSTTAEVKTTNYDENFYLKTSNDNHHCCELFSNNDNMHNANICTTNDIHNDRETNPIDILPHLLSSNYNNTNDDVDDIFIGNYNTNTTNNRKMIVLFSDISSNEEKSSTSNNKNEETSPYCSTTKTTLIDKFKLNSEAPVTKRHKVRGDLKLSPSAFSISSSSSSSTEIAMTSLPPLNNRMYDRNDDDDGETLLSDGFTPGKWDVICGRGKISYDHIGNRRFRIIVANNFETYVKATTQLEKAIIIKNIIQQIRYNSSVECKNNRNTTTNTNGNTTTTTNNNNNIDNFCCVGGGGFVAKDSRKINKWYEVGNVRAREKVGHAFRDYMKGILLRRNQKTISCNDEIHQNYNVNDNTIKSDELLSYHIHLTQDKIFQSCRLITSSPHISKKRRRRRNSKTNCIAGSNYSDSSKKSISNNIETSEKEHQIL